MKKRWNSTGFHFFLYLFTYTLVSLYAWSPTRYVAIASLILLLLISCFLLSKLSTRLIESRKYTWLPFPAIVLLINIADIATTFFNPTTFIFDFSFAQAHEANILFSKLFNSSNDELSIIVALIAYKLAFTCIITIQKLNLGILTRKAIKALAGLVRAEENRSNSISRMTQVYKQRISRFRRAIELLILYFIILIGIITAVGGNVAYEISTIYHHNIVFVITLLHGIEDCSAAGLLILVIFMIAAPHSVVEMIFRASTRRQMQHFQHHTQ